MNQLLLNDLLGIIYMFSECIMFEGMHKWMNEWMEVYVILTPKPVVPLLWTICAAAVNPTEPLHPQTVWDKRIVVHCINYCKFFSFLSLHCNVTDSPVNKLSLSLLLLLLSLPCHMLCPLSHWQKNDAIELAFSCCSGKPWGCHVKKPRILY